MLASLAEEFRDELRRCGWEMTDELVVSALSVYLKARIRKIEEVETESSAERETRLEKKREWNRRSRKNGKLRDVGSEVFGSVFPDVDIDVPMPAVKPPRGHGGASKVADDPEPPRSASPIAQSEWRELEDRRDLIERIADRRRKD